MHKAWFALGLFGALATALNIVSLATAAWVTHDYGLSFGLWQYCYASSCTVYSEVDASFWVARLFLIFSACCLLGSFSSCFVKSWNSTSTYGKGVGGCFVAATLLLLIGLCVFTADQYSERNNWGYSFQLGWVAFATSFLLSAASCVVKRRESSDEHQRSTA